MFSYLIWYYVEFINIQNHNLDLCFQLVRLFSRAGSLNQGAAIASSEPILKAAHLIASFKRKMAVVSQKHIGNTHRLGGSSHLPILVSL